MIGATAGFGPAPIDQLAAVSEHVAVLVERLAGLWAAAQALATQSYAASPAVTLALATLLLLPLLSAAGLAMHWRARRAFRRREADRPVTCSVTELLGRKSGHLQMPCIRVLEPKADGAFRRHAVGAGQLRIGREDDNDCCLALAGIDRYHAIIERASEGEFVVCDVSGPGGGGVSVNGHRVAIAQLQSGDVIAVGPARIAFDSSA